MNILAMYMFYTNEIQCMYTFHCNSIYVYILYKSRSIFKFRFTNFLSFEYYPKIKIFQPIYRKSTVRNVLQEEPLMHAENKKTLQRSLSVDCRMKMQRVFEEQFWNTEIINNYPEDSNPTTRDSNLCTREVFVSSKRRK